MSEFSHKQQVVLATLAYHEALGMALTAFECYRFQVVIADEPVSLEEVVLLLFNLVEKRVLMCHQGLYTFCDASILIERSLACRSRAIVERRRASWLFSLLCAVPWVRGSYMSGSLAYGSMQPGADYDVFVVGRSKRLWSVALFSSVLYQLLGVRRSEVQSECRVCLNHFVSTDALHVPHGSMYNAQTYTRLLGLRLVQPSLMARNAWIQGFVGGGLYRTENRYMVRGVRWRLFRAVQLVLEALLAIPGYAVERMSRWVLKRRICGKRRHGVAPGRVVHTDDVLEFHRESPEYDVLRAANQRLQRLGVDVAWVDSGLVHDLPV